MQAPEFNIDMDAFWRDPYPALAQMRKEAPICRVPQLDATLLTRRDDIFVCEKNTDVFSSDQPGGLMTTLMGQNMMRKDGKAHTVERKQFQPSVSPRAIKQIWTEQFRQDTEAVLKELATRNECDLVTDFAMPVSAHALRHITGLTNLSPAQMDHVSQAMIDGIANYAGDQETELTCRQATNLIDECIDEQLASATDNNTNSILAVLLRAGQALESIRANIKLAISGGQNEPRDAIAGTAWALMSHPDQLAGILAGRQSWLEAFEEYARWNSPIGMSPRRIASEHTYANVEFAPDSRAFLMFGSGNRDEAAFDQPDNFDVSRDTSKAISFGAGPHYCAGAFASRALIADVALPMLFARFPDMRLLSVVELRGWAFRGPVSVHVALH